MDQVLFADTAKGTSSAHLLLPRKQIVRRSKSICSVEMKGFWTFLSVLKFMKSTSTDYNSYWVGDKSPQPNRDFPVTKWASPLEAAACCLVVAESRKGVDEFPP